MKLNPRFTQLLTEVLLTVLRSSALQPQEASRVHSLLGELKDARDVVDSDGDGIPDADDPTPNGEPPRGGIVAGPSL